MFECPYCHHEFTTKQRLISHLTRNNKCYDVNKIGVPPILAELIGVSGSDKKLDDANPILSDIQNTQTPVISEAPNSAATVYHCQNCMKMYISQKNLDRHLATGKCYKKIDVTVEPLPVIFKSKRENSKKTQNVVEKKSVQKEISKNRKTNIKYIVKENYFEYLISKLGSIEEALKFVRSCIQAKIKGGISLLQKIYFDDREVCDYPIEIIDAKNMNIYYKTPEKLVLDQNCTYIKSVMIDNLRNCYLLFCNHIINNNMNDIDIIFDGYDLGDIQNHVLELSDEKRKDRIIMGLLEHVKK